MKNSNQKKMSVKVYHKVTGKNDHGTPQGVFNYYNRFADFKLDAAASKVNAKCKRYITAEEDALKIEWITKVPKGSAVWLNPPYDRVAEFIKKAFEQSTKYSLRVYCLVAARTDTAWWHDYAIKFGVIRYLKGRICFEGENAGAGFPSAVIVFDRLGQHRLISDVLTPEERGFKRKQKGTKRMAAKKMVKKAVKAVAKKAAGKAVKKAAKKGMKKVKDADYDNM